MVENSLESKQMRKKAARGVSESANIGSKGKLSRVLSQIKGFDDPKVRVEQYMTDSSVAADVIWHSFVRDELFGRVFDLGCGTGMLGLGVLLVAADDVDSIVMVDSDDKSVGIAKENLKFLVADGFVDEKNAEKVKFVVADIADLSGSSDVAEFVDAKTGKVRGDIVVQNPPFGTKQEHADKIFLETALSIAPIVYSFHKLSTTKFVEAVCRDFGADVEERMDFNFPLKQTQEFHKRKLHRIEVSCFRIKRN